VLTVAYLNTVWNVDELPPLLGVFSLYVNIRGLRKGPGKFFSWCPGKVLDFLPLKDWEPWNVYTASSWSSTS